MHFVHQIVDTCDINSEVFSKQSERVSLDSVPNFVPWKLYKQHTFVYINILEYSIIISNQIN